MSDANQLVEKDYLGNPTHTVDSKRRVQVPAKWRADQPRETFTLLLWEKDLPEECNITVLPPRKMRELKESIRVMPMSNPETMALRRLLSADSDSVELDSAGRLCIPEAMAQAAGIETSAVMAGAMDFFQIWNPERHKAKTAKDESIRHKAIIKI